MIHDGAAMNFRPAPRDAIRHWLALSLPLTRRPFETDFPNRDHRKRVRTIGPGRNVKPPQNGPWMMSFLGFHAPSVTGQSFCVKALAVDYFESMQSKLFVVSYILASK